MTETHRTLANFTRPSLIWCFHCGANLPSKTPVEVFEKWIVAYCPECGGATVLNLEENEAA
jgi:hypothetical protein